MHSFQEYLYAREKKTYSRNGEDGVLEAIFKSFGISNRIYVEFLADLGLPNNTRLLRNAGWTGFTFQPTTPPTRNASEQVVDLTQEHTLHKLKFHDVPTDFDLLSIDLDFNDFHVLTEILKQFTPKIIVVEFNSSLGVHQDAVVPHISSYTWDGTQWFGASLTCMYALAKNYGYVPVYVESSGTNLFLVREADWGERPRPAPHEIYRSPRYGLHGQGHPIDSLKRPFLSSKHYLTENISCTETRYGRISYMSNDEYVGRTFQNGNYWDEFEIKIISSLLNESQGWALDVGAFIGSHSIALARLCPQLRFVCYEPQEVPYLLLERNIAENQLYSRIITVRAAVTHTNVPVRLARRFTDGHSASDVVSYELGSPANYGGIQLGTDGPEIASIKIDDIPYKSIDYIKIDTEGSERLVFFGAREVIAKDRPVIHFEWRADRQLHNTVLDYLKVGEEVKMFNVPDFLTKNQYIISALGQDRLAVPRPHHSCVGESVHLKINPPLKLIPEDSLPAPTSEWTPTRDLSTNKVPRILFQTWKTRDSLPPYFSDCRKSLTSTNNIRFPLWSDPDNRKFIETHFEWFLSTYDRYPLEIYRADSVRYFFLYAFGGIYADLDVIHLRNLDYYFDQSEVILGRMGTDSRFEHSIPNALMMSPARHPFWLLVIAKLITASQQDRINRPEYMTGPVILWEACATWAQDSQTARQLINSVAKKIPDWHQPIANDRVRLLDAFKWFPLDWSDPIHQEYRQRILNQGRELMPTHIDLQNLFAKSDFITMWSHSWE